MKRTDYLEWNEYFMSIAILSSLRSKDPKTQVGACIVDENKRIIGIGYNGFPNGCSDDHLPWNSDGEWLETKYPYVVHAEVNAIMNKNNNSSSYIMYVTLFPCNECSKLIIQAGIKEIYYLDNKNDESYQASVKLLDLAGIKFTKLKINREIWLKFI